MKDALKKLFCIRKEHDDQVSKKEEEITYNEASDFETAVSAAGFGKFNIVLILLSIPMCWNCIFETTVTSYIIPAAQCDLDLSLKDKGMMIAVIYAGTISSAFLWGYLFDTLGRRRLLLGGFLLNGLFVILGGFSQNATFLMVMKFMGGFIMNGPFAAITSYLSELHSSKYRSHVPILMGLWNSLGSVYLPLLAAVVLPMQFKLVITNNLVLHSWGLYILLNALPAIISALAFVFLPESPKFLMSMGRNDEALDVFRRIYSINTGKPKEDYPIKVLIQETEEKDKGNTSKSKFTEGLGQMLPLFRFPLLNTFLLVCIMQFCSVMSLNTLRLWIPQLFQAINDYKAFNNGTSSTLCDMLSVIQPSEEQRDCFVNSDNLEVYVNSMIVSATAACSYLIAGSLVRLLGQKTLLAVVNALAAVFGVGIYFAPNGEIATVCISGFTSAASLSTNVILIVVVNLFPTTLRTMALSLVMMFGRSGAMIGNISFPYLLESGCAASFLSVSSFLFIAFVFTLLLPKENKNFI